MRLAELLNGSSLNVDETNDHHQRSAVKLIVMAVVMLTEQHKLMIALGIEHFVQNGVSWHFTPS
jgi:hypothetical protein